MNHQLLGAGQTCSGRCEGKRRGSENPHYDREVKLEVDNDNLLEEDEQVSAVAVPEEEASVHEVHGI